MFRNWMYLIGLLILIAGCSNPENQKLSPSKDGISVSVRAKSGNYSIHTQNPSWNFSGSVGQSLSDIDTSTGSDSIGAYETIQFSWTADNTYRGSIRRYDDAPVVLFSLAVPDSTSQMNAQFPSFTSFPDSMHHFSYPNHRFAPATFELKKTSTPWLFFNDEKQAFVFSPASDFIVSKMMGDGRHKITSGLNPKLKNIPANFTHHSVLVLGNHIDSVWTRWGQVLRSRYNKKRASADDDPMLKYYGYWTDHGAHYYYEFDKSKGYNGTLQAIKEHYKNKSIPFGYLQLDSWWYEKSIYDFNGDKRLKAVNQPKWERRGGMMKYEADPNLFPHGLGIFQQKIDVPLVVHNRWTDPHSPYHEKYDITGYTPIDLNFWDHIAQYLDSSGVAVYEQDWLDRIYSHTPRMASDISVGNDFTDHMAQAMKSHGLTIQYCMALPRFFMQGVKYNNVTTIRTSDDRFEPLKWRDFMYSNQFAYAMGIWPWSDVFKSGETGNMIASVLSGGVVGTGDAIGKEDKSNIMKAVRTDGILVKPDAALRPMDINYLNEANHKDAPKLAYNYTEQNNLRTNYVLAFTPTDSANKQVTFRPAALGMKGPVVIYNPLNKKLHKVDADSMFTTTLSNSIDKKMDGTNKYDYAYYILAPITSTGIGFLGDEGKIAATGRQRIITLRSAKGQLEVQVDFAKGESFVRLHGYYEQPIKTDKGKLSLTSSDHMFVLKVQAPEHGDQKTIHLTQK